MNRLQRRKREVREKILAAAFDLFLRQGVAAKYSLETNLHNLGVALAELLTPTIRTAGTPPSRQRSPRPR